MPYCTNSWVNSLVCELAYFLLSGCPFRHSDPELLKQKLQSYKIPPSGITQVRHILLNTFINKALLFNFTFYSYRKSRMQFVNVYCEIFLIRGLYQNFGFLVAVLPLMWWLSSPPFIVYYYSGYNPEFFILCFSALWLEKKFKWIWQYFREFIFILAVTRGWLLCSQYTNEILSYNKLLKPIRSSLSVALTS